MPRARFGHPPSALVELRRQRGVSEQDHAGRLALAGANPRSIRENLEYGGLIYELPSGRYSYTRPLPGTDQGFNPSSARSTVPPGAIVVGDYHTHGDYSVFDPVTGRAIRTGDPARDAFNSDNFSSADLAGIAADAAGAPNYRGYLGTPSGALKAYDPSTGTTYNINRSFWDWLLGR